MMYSFAPRKKTTITERLKSSDKSPLSSRKTRVIRRNYWQRPDTTYDSNKRRLKFSVSGTVYETYEKTLNQFPETTLGSPLLRNEYYDASNNIYVLPCDKFAFDAILFYYQSNGILSRPQTVAGDVFREELKFFRIKDHRFPCLEESGEQSKARYSDDNFKSKVWTFLENPSSSICAKIFSYITIFLIIFGVCIYILETLPEFSKTANDANSVEGAKPSLLTSWFYMETVCIVWFSLEYVLRIIFAPSSWQFVKSPFGLLDLIAIVPFYTKLVIEESVGVDSLIVVRLVRIVKSLRLLKISRYYSGLQVFARAVHDCREKLRALAMCILIVVILFSTFMFHAESFQENEHTSEFKSIPDTFWYTIITMVTVGYGDVVPKTIVGKILGSYCAIIGLIILYCLPTPIVVLHFNKLYKEYVKSSGKEISKKEKALVIARS
ncbi:potassium voltage-gated channel protein Shaker-like [Xenia sp. Carnegie-2017]|uniref:potassium voltage-gated channel protein Shaker-like n=1 Tax=Xenia sp. Carnegie-2017 TaxID=2897299 RepID=UPI001F040881|nr:potassium voltage-gated channel protein Shaker-like [Xenia sp. Carnegie-2017]XP_046858339.1 potassium voltage-gated channel protein Shaker-like [Xenia sp. Carnegie-2017]XP_046858347.1 potassium voltage-gated channel protein Shaker-like [Xenia sp. Carnegie-2017]XP_046858356.1 potassium voltage-gated channel protein Shaker-like [Xenia sp. Carnegie-2017]